MKRKILIIALSLALLVSLFAFAIPVSAEWWKHTDFDVTIDGTFTGRDSDNSVSDWYGEPVDQTLPVLNEGSEGGPKETRTIENGTIRMWHPIITYFDVVADFGGDIGTQTGTAISTGYVIFNRSTNTGLDQRTLEFDFDSGTINAFIISEIEILYWANANPTRRGAGFDAEGSFEMYGGTGIFENFICNGSFYKAPGAQDWFMAK